MLVHDFPRHPQIPETDSRDSETEIWSVETEKRVYRIHDSLENGIANDLSQPGGLSQGRAGGLQEPPSLAQERLSLQRNRSKVLD